MTARTLCLVKSVPLIRTYFKTKFAGVELDVVNQAQWDTSLAQMKEQAGELHVLINIVGSNALIKFPEIDIEKWNEIFETNVTAMVRAIQTCAPLIKALPKLAFESHLEEIQEHIEYLDQVFETSGKEPAGQDVSRYGGVAGVGIGDPGRNGKEIDEERRVDLCCSEG